MAKPRPVPRDVVCSECGLPWADHTKNRKTEPTPDVCIRLLKQTLSETRQALTAATRRAFTLPYSSSGTTAMPSWSGIPVRGDQIGKVQ
jgi:hypothetical protein